MVERAKRVETPEAQQTSEPITDVTRWMLMGEIRSAKRLIRADSESALNPEGYRLEFGNDDADLTVYPAESNEALYHLYIENPGSGVEFLVSEGADPANRIALDEKGGAWFRELIAAGVEREKGPWQG